MGRLAEGFSASFLSFQEVAREIKVCMFTTLKEGLELHTRPMITADVDEEGDFWFFTSEISKKVTEINADNTAYMLYPQPGGSVYFNAIGSCTLIKDNLKTTQLWNPAFFRWFPGGIVTPSLCLIKVKVLEIEHWNSHSNEMIAFLKTIKAISKGEILPFS